MLRPCATAFLVVFLSSLTTPVVAAAQNATGSQRCSTFAEFGSQDASKHRFTGEDAAVYLDAVEPGIDTNGWDLVLVFSLSATPFGRELGPLVLRDGGVAVGGTIDCLKGRKFLGPIEQWNALAMVNRRRAGKPVRLAELEQATASGDVEAQTHLGIRREIQQRGSGRELVIRAAEMNVGLAIIALAYWTSGLDRADPIAPGSKIVDPLVDRAAAFCLMRVGSQSADLDVREFAKAHLRDLEKSMSEAERDDGEKRWNLAKGNLARPSCR